MQKTLYRYLPSLREIEKVEADVENRGNYSVVVIGNQEYPLDSKYHDSDVSFIYYSTFKGALLWKKTDLDRLKKNYQNLYIHYNKLYDEVDREERKVSRQLLNIYLEEKGEI